MANEYGEGRGLTGSSLKLVAIFSMLIDHIGASVLERYLMQKYEAPFDFFEHVIPLAVVDLVIRCIGRIAFPIFIFLLVEGFVHTKNRWKYLRNLFLFALVSEIPFDLAFILTKEQIADGVVLDFSYQNVFFTLALGLLTIMGMDAFFNLSQKRVVQVVGCIFALAWGFTLATFLGTDYGGIGVLAIAVMYLFREEKMKGMVLCCLSLLMVGQLEIFTFFVLIPISCYNGKRGWKMKWLFYLFYPAHLLILWLVCRWMGTA